MENNNSFLERFLASAATPKRGSLHYRFKLNKKSKRKQKAIAMALIQGKRTSKMSTTTRLSLAFILSVSALLTMAGCERVEPRQEVVRTEICSSPDIKIIEELLSTDANVRKDANEKVRIAIEADMRAELSNVVEAHISWKMGPLFPDVRREKARSHSGTLREFVIRTAAACGWWPQEVADNVIRCTVYSRKPFGPTTFECIVDVICHADDRLSLLFVGHEYHTDFEWIHAAGLYSGLTGKSMCHDKYGDPMDDRMRIGRDFGIDGGKPVSAPAPMDASFFEIRNGTVYRLKQNVDAEELVIPAGVKGVCIDGLVHGNVRRIVIPEGVVRLGRQSGGYRPGTKLEAVKLPASVRELSPTAFDGHWRRLHSIEVADGSPYTMKDGCLIDTRNGSLVFALPGRGRIIVPSSVKTIGEYAFNSNDATEIVLPEGVLVIDRGAFYDCRSLERLSISASLISIKSDAFKNCGNLAEISVAEGNLRYSARDGLLIDKESATLLRAFGQLISVTIPDDVKIIGANAFSFLKSVVSIVVPDGVRRIEDGAFSYCTKLEELRLPEQVEFCGDHFIMGCESLRSVRIPKGLGSLSGMFSIGGCSRLREIVLPEGLRTISTGGLGAICRCDALERIVLPSSVTRIGSGGAFQENKNLKMFEVHPDNLAFRAEDGVLFSKDMTRLVRCPEAKMGVYKIPDTVQKIDACAFAQCRNLSEIYIPTSVTDIGYGAFKDCPAKTNRVTTLNGEASQSTAKIGRPQKEEHTKTEHGFVASGVFGDSLSRGLVAGFTFATDTSDFIHPERLFRIAHESSRKPLVSNGVLPLNGCYSGPTNTTTDVAISELRYDRFSVAVSFKPDFDGVRYGMPLISFGGGWRWFHVFLNKDGNVDISFRGLFARDVIHFKLKDKFSKNGWNSFVVTFDFDSRRLVAALNHGERAEFDLPNDFAYRFQSDDWDRCRSVQFADLNNGSVFKGEIDSLLLYNRPLSWNEMQQFFGRKILKELFNPGLWGGKSMAMMPSVANRQGSGSNWRIEATDEACFYWNGRLSDGRWALDARLDGHGVSVGLERPRGDGVLDLRKPVLDGTGRTVPIVGIGLDDMKLSHVGVSHSAPIESVNLPDTLIWLGPGALEDCDRLTSVKLPQSLRRIGSCAFSGCSNLNRIDIPTDVEFLSRDRVFMGCSSLEEIVVQSEKAEYKTEDGVLFSSDGKILVAYPGGRRGPYRVPKGVKRISERAFLGCSRLTELYIPASVREIEDYALAGCKGLKHIEFEDSSFDLNQDRVFGRSYPGRPSVSRPTTNLQSNHMPETEVSTGKRSEKDAGKPSAAFDGSMSNPLSSDLMTGLAVAMTSEKLQSNEQTTKDIPELVRIPAGVNAGAAPYANLGLREYENRMSHDMYMDTTEVSFLKWRTVKEWAKTNGYEFINGDKAPDFMGGGDGDKFFEIYEQDIERDKYPATGMTWYDCLKWCNARSEMDGLEPVYCVDGKPYKKGLHEPTADVSKSGWRLPTEDEWQYAARGGKIGLRFPWGNTISHKNASYNGMKNDRAYPYDQSEGEHPIYGGPGEAPVASFDPNGYGLYDIVGNAPEFTQDSNDGWVSVCGGRIGQLAHFLQIQHHDGCEKTERRCGFRAMRLAVEKKAKSETTITVDRGLVEKMVAAIKDSLQQPKSKMAHLARNMATFPSWNKSLKGESYSVGDYVCIWRKAPPLDIDADSRRWQAGLGEEKYRARIKELRTSNLSYLHSLAIYDSAWYEGSFPVPCIVITVEMSRSTEIPCVCAFTPDGHKNFGKSELLSSDAGMLLNAFSAISIAMDNTPDKIGSPEAGFSRLKSMKDRIKRMKDKPKGSLTACTNCKGTGLVNGSLCSNCKGWGKVSGSGAGK